MTWDRNDERGLEHVSASLDRVLGGVLRRAGRNADAAVLWGEWESIAGPEWSGTEPVRLEEGVLVVRVANGLGASRLRFQTKRLMEAIARRVGDGVVTSVSLRIGRE